MAWKELGYYRGWTAYWESHDHRMYAKDGSLLPARKDFRERPKDLEMAWAVFRSWVNQR